MNNNNQVYQFNTSTKINNPIYDETAALLQKTLNYGKNRAEYALKKKMLNKVNHDGYVGFIETCAKGNDIATLNENILALERHIAGTYIQKYLEREFITAPTAKSTMDRVVASKSCREIKALMEPIFTAMKVAKAKALVAKAAAEAKAAKQTALDVAVPPTEAIKGKGKSRKGAAEMAMTSEKACQSWGTPVL